MNCFMKNIERKKEKIEIAIIYLFTENCIGILNPSLKIYGLKMAERIT